MTTKIERKLHKLDATGQAPGRLASEIAILLRGKQKPEFERHLDAGDIVEVANISRMKFTTKKLEQKEYHNYSGYPGGLKTKTMKELKETKPELILKIAVRNMLPANRLRQLMMRRLIIK